jgi:hypothetical protein
MQLRHRRPWLRAPPANPAAEPRVDRVHMAPADRADPARRPPADPAHRANSVDPAERADRAHTAPADQADQVNSVDPADQVDRAHTAPADPAHQVNSADPADPEDTAQADPANSVDRADRVAPAHGMEIRNVATSKEPPGGTDKGPGGRVSHQGRPTTDSFRRPAADGTMVQSTTSVINKHLGGIPDSTNGASTSSVFGSRCKYLPARCLLDQTAKRAPR